MLLPQSLKTALPAVTNDFVALLKDSSLVSVITVVELTKRMTIVAAPEELRDQVRNLTRMQLIRTCAAWRPDLTDAADPTSATRIALKSLAVMLPVHAALFWGLGLYRGIWRYARLPDLEQAGPPRRLRSNFINGIMSLPVRA